MNAIEIRDVTKQFGNVVAVNQLSLAVPEGSIYGFIGPNGSGKTTTIRMIMDILRPDSGEVKVFDGHSRASARDQIGYLPEERGLYKRMTVRQVLRYYGQLKGKPLSQIDPMVTQCSRFADRARRSSFRRMTCRPPNGSAIASS